MIVKPDIETTLRVEIDRVLQELIDPRREDLIPILQELQRRCGYLSRPALIEVGSRMHLPISKVYGVATFYNQFRFQPLGRVHCQVCRGTACHVKGSAAVLDTVRHELQVEPGCTTRDGRFSLETVACTGACGLAPVVVVNERFYGGVTTDTARRLARRWARSRDAS